MAVQLTRNPGGVAALWSRSEGFDGVGMAWLGQAGFAIRAGQMRILIDPFFSDHPARLIPPPISAEMLSPLDWVFCTHGHLDHLDGPTLLRIANVNPQCRFVVPNVEIPAALKAGVPKERLLGANAGQVIELKKNALVRVLPAAHEQLKINADGEHFFLGFVFNLPGMTIYHSGDCVVYEGLALQLNGMRIDVALLPVNGRDAQRLKQNILGNMTAAEAMQLCEDAGIGTMVPCHFEMMAGNTVPRESLSAAARLWQRGNMVLPDLEEWWQWGR